MEFSDFLQNLQQQIQDLEKNLQSEEARAIWEALVEELNSYTTEPLG